MRAMKDSGIEWIGRIPQEWKTIRLRSQFSFGKGLPITKADLTESGVAVISYGQIHSKANTGTTIKPDLIRYVDPKYLTTNESSVVTSGDFIFADTSEDISGCGNCVYVDVDYPLFAGYHTMILRPESDVSTKFYSYLFATDAWRSQIRAQASGVKLFSITQKMLRDTLLIEPPEEEKDRIVEYLDEKCAAIDTLIAAKEKTNALLKERRQSIIYEAVTKGLNPNAPMKDSGIEWIGQIPENWSTVRVKYTGSYKSGNTITAADVKESGNFPVYGGNGLRGYTDEITHDGDHLLIGRQGALCGNVHMVSGKFWASEHAVVGTINANYAIRFLFYVLDVFDLNRLSTSAAQPGISVEQITGVVIPCPTFVEQQEIANVLDAKCAEVDELISANEATIQKLKEYRQSIIYEAVTGKIEI